MLIASDVLIWGAYLAIPVLLAYFLRKRKDIPFPRILWLFVAFIFACGTTHLVDAGLFWWPVYRLSAVVKFATALVSWMTVAALIPLIPKLLALQSSAQLELIVDERTEQLQRIANELKQEVERRTMMTRQLEEQGTRLRLALEAGRMGTWDWDLETGNIAVDSVEQQILGLDAPHGMISLQDFMRKVDPADREQLQKTLQNVIREHVDYDHQFRFHSTPDQVRWLAGRGEAVRDENGRTVRMRGINFDVTEFKVVHTQLSDSQKFLQSVLNSSADGIKVIDLEGYLLSSNKSGLKALQLEGIEDIKGVYWPSLWPESMREGIENALQTARQGGIGRIQGERPTIKGDLRYWDVIVTPVESTGNQFDRLLCISRDITDQKQTSAVLAGHVRALQLAVNGATLNEVLEVLTETVEQAVGHGLCAAISLMDPKRKLLRFSAGRNLPKELAESLEEVDLSAESQPAARVTAQGEPVLVTDLASDPLVREKKDMFARHGIKSLWSSPIVSSDERVLGAFTIYLPEARGPSSQVKQLVSDLARTATLAIERMRTGEALAQVTAESEQFHRLHQAILSSTPDLVCVFDLNHRLTYANEAQLEAWNTSWPEVQGKTPFDLGYEAVYAEHHDREISHVISTKHSIRGEVPFVGRHGRRIFDYILVPVFEGDGEVGAVAVMNRDVTLSKDAEEALRLSEDRFRTLADNISPFAWMTDEYGNVVWYNQRWFDYTGTTLEQMQGWGWRAVHHPDHVERVVAKLSRCFETGEYWEDTFPLRSKTGEYRWFLSRANPIRDENGKVVRWFGTNTDITEQMTIQNELRVRTRAIEFATNGILITDAIAEDNPIVYTNPAFEGLTGYSLQEVEGKNCRFLQGKKTDPRHVSLLHQAIERREECHVTILNYTKDGRPFWNDLHVSPVQDERGSVTHFVGVQTDITPRIRYERRLEEAQIAAQSANRAKSEFLANMSHEIRTPLTAILGCAESLYRQLEDPDPKDAVRMIRDQGQLLLGILNDILDLSKIEAGKLEIRKESCELIRVISDVHSLMHPQAVERGINLKIRYATKIPSEIHTDPLRLRQILLNLVSNAVKFTELGWVEIGISCDRDSQGLNLVLIVSDTGIGISPSRLTSIFDAFTQDKSARTKTVPGTGLGLTICQKLTNMLGGTISVVSEEGKGSRFTVRLPLGEIDSSQLQSAEEIQDFAARRDSQGVMDQFIPCRVLIAEDTRGIQFMMTRMLQDVVRGVALADNGEAAVEALKQAIKSGDPFDIVLMDMQMPVMNGFQATLKLRDEGIQVPVVALTAGAMAGDREKCIACGCTDYLSKPVNRDELLAVLRKYCSPA
ncbi:MAG: PAS domain S-box protein [Planctomycetales bacterium]